MLRMGVYALSILSAASSVLAHGYVSDLIIDGKYWPGFSPYFDLTNGTGPGPARIAYSIKDNWPVYDPLSTNITCNYNPYPGPPSLTAPAKAGSQIQIVWTSWPTNHVGVTMTYMGLCPESGGCRSPDLDISDISWFKIHESGYDSANKKWFTEGFVANNSTLVVTVPKNLKSGEYLVRHEQLSLHAVREAIYGPEFYPSCFQVKVQGSGSVLPAGVKFPGGYTKSDPGVYFDIYKPYTSYPIPGPPIDPALGL